MSKGKVAAEKALAVVKLLLPELKQVTERLIVAGSLRRRKQMVGDIEICYIPMIRPGAKKDFFSEPEPMNLADSLIEHWVALGTLVKRQNALGSVTWGQWNKLAVHADSGIGVDFFATTEDWWFNNLVCRTGPAELNKRICMEAQKRGWKWNSTKAGFSKRQGLGEEHRRMGSEREVFEFVGLPYQEPWERI